MDGMGDSQTVVGADSLVVVAWPAAAFAHRTCRSLSIEMRGTHARLLHPPPSIQSSITDCHRHPSPIRIPEKESATRPARTTAPACT